MITETAPKRWLGLWSIAQKIPGGYAAEDRVEVVAAQREEDS